MGHKTLQFGSLYVDEQPCIVPQNPIVTGDIPHYSTFMQNPADAPSITIGDSEYGQTITWIKPDDLGILVADRVLLVDVSWTDLCDEGFEEGREVDIDGVHYLCRLIRPLNKEDMTSETEWDLCIKQTSSSNRLWHWRSVKFFERGFPTNNAVYCRGSQSSRNVELAGKYEMSANLGFRPVLEPIFSKSAPDMQPVILDEHMFSWGQCMAYIARNEQQVGFRPVLVPQKPLFEHLAEGTDVKMYTLMMGDTPVRMDMKNAPAFKQGGNLWLTDRYFGDNYLIPWIIKDGCAMASKDLLSNTLLSLLAQQGLAPTS